VDKRLLKVNLQFNSESEKMPEKKNRLGGSYRGVFAGKRKSSGANPRKNEETS